MRIVWSNLSRYQLQEIYDYYATKVHATLASRIIDRIILDAEKLIHEPFIGQREPLLAKRPQDFRYLVSGNYKIIYWVDNNIIRIASVFDCRQNPEKLKSF
jgi:toxin ParE1/3/4